MPNQHTGINIIIAMHDVRQRFMSGVAPVGSIAAQFIERIHSDVARWNWVENATSTQGE